MLKKFLANGVSVEKRQSEFFIIIKPDLAAGLSGNIQNGDGGLLNYSTALYGTTKGWNISYELKNNGAKIIDCTCPEISADGTLTGNMHGFVLIAFPTFDEIQDIKTSGGTVFGVQRSMSIDVYIKDALKDLSKLRYARQAIQLGTTNDYQFDNLKFNFSNVLAEFKNGEENQNPLGYFNTIFIDQQYGSPLYGPFSTSNGLAPQKIKEDSNMLTRSKDFLHGPNSTQFNLDLENGLPIAEGSEDIRLSGTKRRNYSEWANNSLKNWDEKAIPVTHQYLILM